MRLMFDMNMPRRLAGEMRALGHDVEHLGEVGLGHLSDDTVFARTAAEQRVVVTFDLDFGEIVAQAAHAGCGVVLLWLRSVRLQHIRRRLDAAIVEAQAALEAGTLVVVEDARIRIRHVKS